MTSTTTKISLPRSEITFSFFSFIRVVVGGVYSEIGMLLIFNLHVFALISGSSIIDIKNQFYTVSFVVQTMGNSAFYSENLYTYTAGERAREQESQWYKKWMKSTPVYEVDKAKVKSIFFYWIGADNVGIHTLIVAFGKRASNNQLAPFQ